MKPFRYLVYLLFLVGVWASARHCRRSPVHGLGLAASLAILISIPFMHGGESRGFASSVGFLALVCGLGATETGRLMPRLQVKEKMRADGPFGLLAGLGVIGFTSVAIFVTAGLIAGGSYSKPAGVTPCRAGSEPITLLVSRGAGFALGPIDDRRARAVSPAALMARIVEQERLATSKARWRHVVATQSRGLSEQMIHVSAAAGEPVFFTQAISISGARLEMFGLRGDLLRDGPPIRSACFAPVDGILLQDG